MKPEIQTCFDYTPRPSIGKVCFAISWLQTTAKLLGKKFVVHLSSTYAVNYADPV